MKLIVVIGTGSFIGGIFRYLLSLLVLSKTNSIFPFSTLIVNITGCFCIGIIIGIFGKLPMTREWELFLVTGILGGFTTFSTFSNDTLSLFKEGHTGFALLYILASVILGLFATYIAYLLMKHF